MPNLNLDRSALAQIAQGNQRTLLALEKMVSMVSGFPLTIEEANALAGAALAAAQSSAASLSLLLDALERLETAPAAPPHADVDDTAPAVVVNAEPDDTTPRVHLGTISSQNADSVELTGPLTSTVTTGTAPLIVASKTRVANLNVAAAGVADGLTSPSSYPAPASDLPTVIALANALRAAAINKGL